MQHNADSESVLDDDLAFNRGISASAIRKNPYLSLTRSLRRDPGHHFLNISVASGQTHFAPDILGKVRTVAEQSQVIPSQHL